MSESKRDLGCGERIAAQRGRDCAESQLSTNYDRAMSRKKVDQSRHADHEVAPKRGTIRGMTYLLKG